MAPICIFDKIFGIFWISKKGTLLKIQFLTVSILQKYFYTKNWMKSDAFKLISMEDALRPLFQHFVNNKSGILC